MEGLRLWAVTAHSQDRGRTGRYLLRCVVGRKGVNCKEATFKQERETGPAVDAPQDSWRECKKILLQGVISQEFEVLKWGDGGQRQRVWIPQAPGGDHCHRVWNVVLKCPGGQCFQKHLGITNLNARTSYFVLEPVSFRAKPCGWSLQHPESCAASPDQVQTLQGPLSSLDVSCWWYEHLGTTRGWRWTRTHHPGLNCHLFLFQKKKKIKKKSDGARKSTNCLDVYKSDGY